MNFRTSKESVRKMLADRYMRIIDFNRIPVGQQIDLAACVYHLMGRKEVHMYTKPQCYPVYSMLKTRPGKTFEWHRYPAGGVTMALMKG